MLFAQNKLDYLKKVELVGPNTFFLPSNSFLIIRVPFDFGKLQPGRQRDLCFGAVKLIDSQVPNKNAFTRPLLNGFR
jgi:hypothetical protein